MMTPIVMKEIATRVAKMYVERFPREEHYLVSYCSLDDDWEGYAYKTLSSDEKDIVNAWKNDPEGEADGMLLDEYLETHGHQELLDRLNSYTSDDRVYLLKSVDLNDTRKYMRIEVQECKEVDGKQIKYAYNVPVSDDDFVELLAERISAMFKAFTFNMMVYKMPELAQSMMKYVVETTGWDMYDNPNPFAIVMTELEEIAYSILNPGVDVLGIWHSDDDPAFAEFLQECKIVPSESRN